MNCAKSDPPDIWEREIELAEIAMDSHRLHTWFTDGSGLEDGHRGGAAWCPSIKTHIKQYLGRLATVHDGELVGIDRALHLSTEANADALLLSDSEAAIQTTLKLAKGGRTSIRDRVVYHGAPSCS